MYTYTVEDKWCKDCNRIVPAEICTDEDTGTIEWICPESPDHELEDIKTCACGEMDIGVSESLCPWCKKDIMDAWARFKGSINPNLDMYDVMEFVDTLGD